METIKEKYTAELRTKLSVKYKKINPSDYNYLSEFLIGDKKYRCYESHQVIDSNWDDFVTSVNGSCVQQLSGWVDVKQLEGWNFKRIIYVNEGIIIGGYQMLIKKLLFPLKIGYINHGPVLSSNNSKIVERILNDFEKLCKKNKINVAVINPPIEPKELVDEFNLRYSKNHIYNLVEAEAELDISYDEEFLYRSFLRMRKQNIHKSNKYEFKVVEGTEDELENFFNLMNETCKRNNVKPNPPSIQSLKKIWEYYYPKNFLKLYNFYIGEELISSILAFEYHDTFTPWKFGWSGNKSSYKPNDVFHWELIKIAKRKGFKKYNFGGINKSVAEKFLDHSKKLNPEEQKSSTFFKMGFGCYIKEFPESKIYIPNSIIRNFYRLYLLLVPRRDKLRKLLNLKLSSYFLIFK